MTTERLLILVEVADLLRVSPHTVRAWVRKGRLQPLRICRRLLFDPAEVSRFLTETRSTEMATVSIAPDDSHC